MRLKLLAGFLSILTVFVGLISRTDDIHDRGMFLVGLVVILHQWLMLVLFLRLPGYRIRLKERASDGTERE